MKTCICLLERIAAAQNLLGCHFKCDFVHFYRETKSLKLLFVLNIQNRNDVAMFFMFPWYTFFLAKLGTVRPTRFLLAKWQTPKQIVFFLHPQFALRQLPYSGIERSLLNSCNLVLNTTSKHSVPEFTFLHLPVLLLAHTIQGHACSSNPHVEVVRGGVML